MEIIDIDGKPVENPDLSKGRVIQETIIKDGATPLSDAKQAWYDDDYVMVNRYIEYTPEEIAEREKAEMAQAIRRQTEIAALLCVSLNAASFSDEQALTVRDLLESWCSTGHYASGDIRRYAGELWRCRKEHDAQPSWTPDQAHSLWGRIVPPGTIEEWRQPQPGVFDGYTIGQRVTHNGKTWESTYNGLNVCEPGVYGWVEII